MALRDNPPSQVPADLAIEEFKGCWWVAHTKPRQEKALAWDVLLAGGQYFLPMRQATRRSRGRSWKTALPLFTGYIFLCGSERDRLAALRTNRIANLINVVDQSRLVEECSAIQRLLALGLAVGAHPGLSRGKKCRIRKGPLADLEGRVERHKGRDRFIVSVAILGQGAMVEINADLLEPCE